MSKKKLKTWVVVLLVLFYPIGIAYLVIRLIVFIVKNVKSNKSAKPAPAPAPVSAERAPAAPAAPNIKVTTFTELPMIYKKNITAFRENRNYIVYDLETTGLDPYEDEIIEISLLKITGGIETDRFSTLVNPGMHIPEAASKVNHIYDTDVADAPHFYEIADQVVEFIGTGYPLVGHNIGGFDNGFLAAALGDRSLTYTYIDTLPMARKALPDLPNHKLITLIKHYGLGSKQTHRAMDDVVYNQIIFGRLCDEIMNKKRQTKAE